MKNIVTFNEVIQGPNIIELIRKLEASLLHTWQNCVETETFNEYTAISVHDLQETSIKHCFSEAYQVIPGNDQNTIPANQEATGSKLDRTS